jgi:DNA-binding XRE family transcriptional regulator
MLRGLREARAENNLIQPELAEKSGVSLSTINLIENGRVYPYLSTRKNLMDVLGPIDWDLTYKIGTMLRWDPKKDYITVLSMKKLIIDNRSRMSMSDALTLIQDVVKRGKVSNNGKQYCYLTKFKYRRSVYTVSSTLNATSETLIIREENEMRESNL